MSAKNKLLEYISRYINFSPEEMKIFMSVIEVSNLKKKQMIVQPGFVCQYMCYITKGALRSYFVDQEGNEHCIGFAVDDWWISDYNSFIYQEPATLFVEALENSEIVKIDYYVLEKLYLEIPKLERFFRIMTQRSFGFMQRRMLSNLSLSAKDRYEEFVDKYPHIVNQIPQYVLASYLGMSTEYYSKLRNNKIV